MKKLLAILAALAAFVSCLKTNLDSGDELKSINTQFDIQIGELEPGTRAIKKQWTDGDKVNIWFNGHVSDTPDVVFTYDGGSWTHNEPSRTVINELADGGKILAVFESSNNLSAYNYYPDDPGVFCRGATKYSSNFCRPAFMTASCSQTYSYSAGKVTAKLNDWSFATKIQVVVTGLDRSDGSFYALRCNGLSLLKQFSVTNAGGLSCETESGQRRATLGVPNEDGLAFYFVDTDSNGTSADYEFTILKFSADGQNLTTSAITAYGKTLSTSSGKCKGIKLYGGSARIPVTGVSITPASPTISVGGKVQLEAVISPENATIRDITWSSESPAVATVDENGLVTGVKGGWTNIYATSADGNKAGMATVTVESIIPVEKVQTYTTELNLRLWNPDYALAHEDEVGRRISVAVTPSNCTTNTLEITQTDSNVASVYRDGGQDNGVQYFKIVPKHRGTTEVTFTSTSSGLSASCTVNVTPVAVNGLNITSGSGEINLDPGKTFQLVTEVLPAWAYDMGVDYSTSKRAVATVDSEGLITAVSKGTAVITATTRDGSFSATRTVNVTDYQPVAWMVLDNTKLELPVGFSYYLHPAINSNATDKRVTWSSSNSNIVTAYADGKITCKNPGTCTITCTAVDNGMSATCQVTCGIKGKMPVLESAGRPDNECGWVQLWEGGPCFAEFNAGATISDYGHLATTTFDGGGDALYSTENVGGLYFWRNPNLNRRASRIVGTDEYGIWYDDDADGRPDGPLVSQALWGRNWWSPTKADFEPIVKAINGEGNKVTCTWCDGVNVKYCAGCNLAGYKVSGTSGTKYAANSIFLPAGGYYYNGSYNDVGTRCSYILKNYDYSPSWTVVVWLWQMNLKSDESRIYDFRYNEFVGAMSVRPIMVGY